jgi:shikimate dehydrogenase
MGLRGVMSRILAPKYGSCITFASIEKNKESAEGQLTINEMKEEYNIDLVNPNTRVLGVIGEFAENSRSRFMHNNMFKEKKLDFIYVLFKTKKEELGEFMRNFREFGFRGSAVTIPHKEAIMKHVDEIDDTAQKIGASNTLVNENGKLIAYNTDYFGAIKALKEKTKLADKAVLVIGAGGAARAIVYALKKEKAKITIINRTDEKAQKLADEFNIEFDRLGNMKELINKNDITINTTSVGMDPHKDESIIKENEFSEGKIIMDIVYKPIRTKLIMLAEKNKCKTITGERMLIYQATGQYNLWTGQNPDFKVMEKALMEKLNKGE